MRVLALDQCAYSDNYLIDVTREWKLERNRLSMRPRSMSGVGQTRKCSLGVDVFRFGPNNGHRSIGSACPVTPEVTRLDVLWCHSVMVWLAERKGGRSIAGPHAGNEESGCHDKRRQNGGAVSGHDLVCFWWMRD